MTTKALILAAASAAALAWSGSPAGSFAPLILRTVTIGGVTAPAYYSQVEGRYRFVGGDRDGPSRMAALGTSIE